jgi:hypothetical protein
MAGVRAGRSGVLVLHGEAGVGKTALLDYLVEHATGVPDGASGGIESEMQLPFAGLHQFCTRCLDHVDRLPGPQREALGTAFGLRGAGMRRIASWSAWLS